MSNSSSNSSEYEEVFKHTAEEFRKNQLWPLSIIFVVGLLTNSMVIFNGIRRRKTIRHYSNYFVLSMAVADWCVVFFTIPLMCVEYLVGLKWMDQYICQFVLPIRETFQGAAIFSISTLAILRVRQVLKNPLEQFSNRTCKIIVALIWLVSFLVSTVPLLDIYVVNPIGHCDPDWPSVLRVRIHVTFITCIILSPMFVATIAYTIVIIKVTSYFGTDPESVRLAKRNRSIALLLIVLIASCWISYTPLAVYFGINLYTEKHVGHLFWQVVTILYFGGSALNPVLVLVTMPKDYCPNIQCKRQRRVGVDPPAADQKEILKSTIPLTIRNHVHELAPS